MAGSDEHGIELFGSVKWGKFLDYLRGSLVLNDSTPFSLV
jgi:hypothetical protein